ncbi:stage II sporulation protein D [Bacillus methanolicus]|uniref:stage II sporulation protein D n=1 Tax=Bacillus methanolicus TaxID=1471 RepID=UPI00200EE199|nr:stage II sporulation protein D [Bacillus methanolicus]UQD53564.1 stage II sporulation protein D [Bacillus methanolicus]
MIKIKPFITLTAILVVVTLMLPALLVLPFSDAKTSRQLGEVSKPKPVHVQAENTSDAAMEVAVYRTAKKKIETLPLDQYLIGVVAAEMPADFQLEALKAQALAARTYIVRQLLNKEKIGLPEGKADVTDTEIHQVYKNNEELKKLWGVDYKWKINKITEAVKETSGQILTYEGNPITPTFFSTSNGYTENSEDYWSNSYPYLRSVASPWDKNSPKFISQKIMSVGEFEARLGVKLVDRKNVGKIIERTAGKRVGKVEINGKVLTGREIRDKLDLRSSDFSWVVKGNNIIITTKGFGHGVGMSQYGANGMASEGKNYKEIVKYYYKGVEISNSDTLLTKVTAKK